MPDGPAALDIPSTADYCDEALRDWLANATERFGWLRTVSTSREVAKATKQFGTRSGRARGRIALQRAYEPVATLQAIGDQGRLPFLCWVFFRPRAELRIVSINFAIVLRFEDGRVSIVAMAWTADVSHDALLCALRHGGQNPDAILMELHERLLDALVREWAKKSPGFARKAIMGRVGRAGRSWRERDAPSVGRPMPFPSSMRPAATKSRRPGIGLRTGLNTTRRWCGGGASPFG